VAERLPVVLVTGFLGSGKTTLLSRLLGRPELGTLAPGGRADVTVLDDDLRVVRTVVAGAEAFAR
jgi:N-acetylglucosamine-6-phosphate deacetylase